MKSFFHLLSILSSIVLFSSSVVAKTKEAPAAKISFESPKDGAKLKSPFKVVMKAEGIKVRPAGEAVDEKTSGHHHLLIDQTAMPEGQPIPADDKHLHFGKGQSETEVSLQPGPHALTLQFADGAHRSYGPNFSQTIKIEVLPAENAGKK